MTALSSFNIEFPDFVRKIISRLTAEGFDAYAVGGCVRDSILGRVPHDWDITTEAVPKDIMRIFAEGSIHVISTAGVRHGTVMVKAGNDVCEITTFRCDGDYNDHRRPDSVTFSKSVEDDLARRDFTMNAIAAKPNGDGFIIKDPFGGADDIRSGIIRTVGDPSSRFTEDALRIMRAVRFAAELGFEVDPETARSAVELCHTLEYISAERITSELWRILSAPYAASVIQPFSAVLEFIAPNSANGRFARYAHDVSDPCLRLALMAEHGTDGSCILERFRFSGDINRFVKSLLSLNDAPKNRRDVCVLMRNFGSALPSVAEYLCVLCDDGTIDGGIVGRELVDAANRIIADDTPYLLSHLQVKGGDIIACGITDRLVGECLEYLLSEVQKGSVPNEKEPLLAVATAKYKSE